MSKRWTIEQIRDFVKENSESKLLSKEYHGYSQKLLFLCSCGDKFEKTFTKFNTKKQRKCEVCQPLKVQPIEE